MNKTQLLDFLWAGDYLSFLNYLDSKGRMDGAPPQSEAQARAYFMEEEDESEKYQGYGYMIDTYGSVASVGIRGTLISQSSWLSRLFGMTGYDEIQNSVLAAAQEPGINNVLLDIDSPGGSVKGLAETGDVIRRIDDTVMPVSSFSSGAMLSAAYWLGSSAREVHATKMASIGSIGVIAVHQEMSNMMEKAGVKATVFTAGKYKGIGNPYEPLSEDDKEFLQASVNESYEFFVEAVADNRGMTTSYARDNVANGKDYYAPEAKELGLIDRISSFQDVVKLLDSSHNPTHSRT